MCGSAGRASAQIPVVTTTPSLADITRQVGGPYVSVESVMRGPEDVHNVSPRPSQMIKVKRADLFIHSGLDAEGWWPLLVKGARNAKLLPGQPGNVDVSRGIALKEVPTQDQLTRALGDVHIYGNTHYHLDPLNGVIIARTIADALLRADPAHAEDIRRRLEEYTQRLQSLTERLVTEMAPYRGTRVVTYHRAWPYFLDRFGLACIGEVEPKPGISPSPGHLREVVEQMRAAGTRIVIVETYNSPENARFVADKVGGRAVVLAHQVNALPQVDTYEKLFEYNVATLLSAFRDEVAEPSPHEAALGRK